MQKYLKFLAAGGLIGIMVFLWTHVLHEEKDVSREVCDEHVWKWTAALDDIEFRVKQWGYLGNACVFSGYKPIEDLGLGVTKLSEIQYSSVLLRDMKYRDKIEIPSGHQFSPGDHILICFGKQVYQSKVEKIQSIGSSYPDVMQLALGGIKDALPKGATVLSYKPSYIVDRFHNRKKSLELYILGGNEKLHRIADQVSQIKFDFGKANVDGYIDVWTDLTWSPSCKLAKSIQLTSNPNEELKRGSWLLGKDQLIYKEIDG